MPEQPLANSAGRQKDLAVAPCNHGANWGDGKVVSVLILNWNGMRFLQPCLSSVIREACEHIEVVLVDNGSADGSVDKSRSGFPRLRIVAFTENSGFARAYNAATREVSGRFVVFLNNDTVVESGWLPPLIDELIRDTRTAITTSKVLFFGTRIVNAAGGQLKLWQGGSELGFGQQEGPIDARQISEPFFASGSAMAISKELFTKIGGFDEHLWLYAEDLDLSWRVRLAGYKIRYVPESVIYHHYSGTSGIFSPVKHRLVTINNLAVMVKCLSTANLLHSVPGYALFALAKGAGLAVAERNSAYFTNVLLSFRVTAMSLGELRLRRRETQKLRVLPDSLVLHSDGFGLFDPPWTLLRALRQGRRLKRQEQPEQPDATSAAPSA